MPRGEGGVSVQVLACHDAGPLNHAGPRRVKGAEQRRRKKMMTEILTADDGDRKKSMIGIGGECRRGRGEDGSLIRVLASMSFSLELPVACTLLTSNAPVLRTTEVQGKNDHEPPGTNA